MSDPENNSLVLIEKLLTSFKDGLLRRIKNDEKEWFPYCLSLSNPLKDAVFSLEMNHFEETDDPIEALLTDFRHIMIKHLSGEYDENLCHAVIFAVSLLAKDVKQHNRIRFRILQPIVEGMKQNGL